MYFFIPMFHSYGEMTFLTKYYIIEMGLRYGYMDVVEGYSKWLKEYWAIQLDTALKLGIKNIFCEAMFSHEYLHQLTPSPEGQERNNFLYKYGLAIPDAKLKGFENPLVFRDYLYVVREWTAENRLEVERTLDKLGKLRENYMVKNLHRERDDGDGLILLGYGHKLEYDMEILNPDWVKEGEKWIYDYFPSMEPKFRSRGSIDLEMLGKSLTNY